MSLLSIGSLRSAVRHSAHLSSVNQRILWPYHRQHDSAFNPAPFYFPAVYPPYPQVLIFTLEAWSYRIRAVKACERRKPSSLTLLKLAACLSGVVLIQPENWTADGG